MLEKRTWRCFSVGVILLVLPSLTTAQQVTALPEGTPPEAMEFASEWSLPNKDLSNTREVTDSPITSENVATLGVMWTQPIMGGSAYGRFTATPIIVDGVTYLQDMASNVVALDLETGEVQWERSYDAPTVGPNGVTVGYGRVYGATPTFAFALDMETGEEVWRSKELIRNGNEGIDMVPGIFGGRVYVSTVPGNLDSFYAGNGMGTVWALDAETGEKVWSFNTTTNNLWGNPEINSGGGLWHPPAFDGEGNMFFSVANPAPWTGTEAYPWGGSRPGDNLYTNSLVKLNADSGAMECYNQVLPHDVYDWDLHLPPIFATAFGRSMVLTAGKMGYVYGIDPNNCDLLWKTQVGRHNGHDEDNERALAGEQMPQLPVTIFPGVLGGVETQMAVSDGVVFVPIVNLPTTFVSQEESQLELTGGTGAMWALNVSSGSVKWQTDFPTPVYGAATVVNDLVFTTTFDGTLYALDKETGETVWSDDLPAATNAQVSVVGDTLITAGSYPQGEGQEALFVAYKLGQAEDTETGGAESGGAETGGTTNETQDADSESAKEGPSGELEEAGGASAAPQGEVIAAGRELFQSDCGTCHVLSDAGTNGQVGPNLDQTQTNRQTIVQQIRNGGGGMPSFAGQLTDEQIETLATYIAQVRDSSAEESSGAGQGSP